ncbi:hypothetical protein PKOR_07715 [Pontibacter korlensis]|uniref:Beta-carotene 15,15'-monooxygenase n=1 Tax=Pontibacter korlensis TaxID=400092 RepID=A0A0E3ZDE0_9BACT|nr:hypothetical protein PKOR_07715 [Pontibacter korlensis]
MINLEVPSNAQKPLISDEYLSTVVEYHKEHPAFAKRPLTTYLLEQLDSNSCLSKGESFTVVNFILLFLCGLSIYSYSVYIGNHPRNAVLSIVCFFLSFSILFAFFPPIYSYDEPLHYFLVYLSLIALTKGKWLLYILLFSLSLITRESSLLLLPGLALMTVNMFSSRLHCLRKLFFIFLPIIPYAVYLFIFIAETDIEASSKQDLMTRLLHFHYNFQSPKFIVESIMSLFLAIGIQSYLLYSYLSRNRLTTSERILVNAFLLVTVLNTAVVFLTTWARETRLFTLPLIFLWPILAKIVSSEYRYIRTKLSKYKICELFSYILLLLVLITLSTLVTNKVYFQTIGSMTDNFFNEYSAAASLLLFFHFIFRFLLKPRTHQTSNM